jgi:membrane-bound lytic murein transglycosylase D
MEPFLDINQLQKKSRLSMGTNLLIPLPKEMEKKTDSSGSKPSNGKDPNGKSDEIIYTIKKGDSLWSIANEMGVNIGALTNLNNLDPEAKLMPGDQLKVRVTTIGDPPLEVSQDENGKKEIIYVVKSGDSLWSIANRYNVSIPEIKSWNHLNGNNRIYPSDKLKLMVEEPKS